MTDDGLPARRATNHPADVASLRRTRFGLGALATAMEVPIARTAEQRRSHVGALRCAAKRSLRRN